MEPFHYRDGQLYCEEMKVADLADRYGTPVAATMPSIRMIGLHMHIGSQITTTEPYAGAVTKGVELIGRLRGLGHPIKWYNMGGGYAINYRGMRPAKSRSSLGSLFRE